MSNSGSSGRASGFDREAYGNALADLRNVLETKPVVGWPKREAELFELERLIQLYTSEARQILDRTRPATDEGPDRSAT